MTRTIMIECPACNGNGWHEHLQPEEWIRWKECFHCHGSGEIEQGTDPIDLDDLDEMSGT